MALKMDKTCLEMDRKEFLFNFMANHSHINNYCQCKFGLKSISAGPRCAGSTGTNLGLSWPSGNGSEVRIPLFSQSPCGSSPPHHPYAWSIFCLLRTSPALCDSVLFNEQCSIRAGQFNFFLEGVSGSLVGIQMSIFDYITCIFTLTPEAHITTKD